jgi:hypothetical protein
MLPRLLFFASVAVAATSDGYIQFELHRPQNRLQRRQSQTQDAYEEQIVGDAGGGQLVRCGSEFITSVY